MNKKSESKAIGESNAEAEKQLSDMPSSSEEKLPNILATSANTPDPQSQIGFLPTNPLDIDEETANAKLVVTFAQKLGALVTWRRLELADGQDVIALCFSMDKWTVGNNNELVAKLRKPSEEITK